MEQNFVIIDKIHDSKAANNANGGWSNNVIAQYSDRNLAETKYYSELARLNSALDYDFVMVMMIDTYGGITSKYRDSRTEPTPEPEV